MSSSTLHECLRFIIGRDDAWLEVPVRLYIDFCRRWAWRAQNGFYSAMHAQVYLLQFPDAPYFLTRIDVDLSLIPEVFHADSVIEKYEPIALLHTKENLV